MKKYLLTGLITLLPIAITIFIIVWLVDFFTEPFVGVAENFIIGFEKGEGFLTHHTRFVVFLARIASLLFLFGIIFLLGYIGQKLQRRYSSQILSRIPYVKGIYRFTKEITHALFAAKDKAFKETVLIPFPKPETHALGLVTGDVPQYLKEKISHLELTVFVPTAPHPISGFILMTSKQNVVPVDMSTEDVIKFMISCGTSQPEQKS